MNLKGVKTILMAKRKNFSRQDRQERKLIMRGKERGGREERPKKIRGGGFQTYQRAIIFQGR